MSSGPQIDFHLIRPHGTPASRAGGFEEVASIVIRDGIPGLIEWPAGTRFARFGNPDGGREGRGKLPTGEVWARQAKYLFAFGSGEANQVDESVKRALDTEPDLTRYFVALAYDLPAGDTERKGAPVKSAHTRWLEKKAEWEKLAQSKGMNVDFVFVGESELLTELVRDVNNGRVRYWFGGATLSPADQQRLLDDVVAKVDRRYTPKLHVEVEAVRALDGLGRSPEYLKRVQIALAGLRRVRSQGATRPEDDELKDAVDRTLMALSDAEAAFAGFLDAARHDTVMPDIDVALKKVQQPIREALSILRRNHMSEGGYYADAAGAVYSRLTNAREALYEAQSLLDSPDTEAARRALLLLTGRAGVGKTHLFCDVASRRIGSAIPTLVVLGQDFDSSTLLPQIGKLTGLDGNLEDILLLLDAAGEASGSPAMLMIDALNESADPDRWVDDLRVLAGAVDRHPHVTLAVSCRTEFAERVVGDTDLPTVHHLGYGESIPEAVDRYTTEYGLERLAFPAMNPEFGNALFLKLACEALSTLGQTTFTLGAAGLDTVCGRFLQAINRRLAAQGRCDYDEASHLVQNVCRQIVGLGSGPYDRTAVVEITNAALPGRTWSASLYNGLVREGVLMETFSGQVTFSYQKLGDILQATALAEGTPDDVKQWYQSLASNLSWRENGVLGALAVITPEEFQAELIDLLNDDEGAVGSDIVDAFLSSLTLRSPQHTNARTAEIVRNAIEAIGGRAVWSTLLQVACVPGHATNADFTHAQLIRMDLPDRELTWSEWLSHSLEYGNDNPVRLLLDWAWPHPLDLDELPEDVARLATLTLGWLLASTDRRVRDRATSALVAIGERNAEGFAAGIRAFRGCNDPYVVERLTGAVCAVALRSTDPSLVLTVADAASELVADGIPDHIVTRDYLRCTAEAAKAHGWRGPYWKPPYGGTWTPPSLTEEQVKEMTSAPERDYWSIWGSLGGTLGDFGRYIVQAAIEHLDVADHDALFGEVQRVVFARVLDLGWTPERFGDIDDSLRGDQDKWVERFGKKYQWIGFYEALGRLADVHQLVDRWGDSRPYDYTSLDQLDYRDIDPTVLAHAQPDALAAANEPFWFVPVGATFSETVAEHQPTDLDDVPDPLDLIALTDPEGQKWLALHRYGSWTQELPPEIAALKAPRLHAWMQIRSYLVPKQQIPAIRSWASADGGNDYDGRWMPEHAEVYNQLLATHPSSPAWDYVDGSASPRHGGPITAPDGTEITPAMPYGEYSGTGHDRDANQTARGIRT